MPGSGPEPWRLILAPGYRRFRPFSLKQRLVDEARDRGPDNGRDREDRGKLAAHFLGSTEIASA